MKFLTNAGSNIVYEVGEISGAGQNIPCRDDRKFSESELND